MAFVAGYHLNLTAKTGIAETSGDVTGWTDQVTGTRELTVPSGQSSPRVGDVTLNGFNVLSFDGVNGGATLQIDDGQGERLPSAGNYMYSYLLVRIPFTSGSNFNNILDAGNAIIRENIRYNSSDDIIMQTPNDTLFGDLSSYTNTWIVLVCEFLDDGDGNSRILVDGNAINSGSLGLQTGDGLTVGARQDFGGEGEFDVAHIVEYYDVPQHSSSDIQQNVDELMSEWGFGYDLTIITDNGTVTQDPDKEIYDDGEQVELTAVPDQGYQFDSWSGDITSTSNPVMVTMDSDKSITANYIETQLISPEDGATGVSQTPTLDWRDLAGYNDYNVQIATDSGFFNIIHDVIVEGASQYDVPVGVLDGSTTYYWRRYGVRINFDPTIYNEDFEVSDQSGWLEPWNTQNLRTNQVTFEIINGQAVMDFPSASSLGVADLEGVDVDNSVITLKFTLSDISDNFQLTIHFRTSGGWVSEQKTGYYLFFYQGNVSIGSINENHSPGNIDTVPKTLVGGTQYTAELDLNNTAIKTKVWETGQTEPGWDFDLTDSKHSTGRLALKSVLGSSGTGGKSVSFDDISISPQEETPTITQVNELDTELEVHYDAVTGADTHEVQVDSDDPIDTSGFNPFIITGLTNGQTYDVRMRAIIDGTAGAWSEAKQGTPTGGSITDVTISEGDFSISENGSKQLSVTVETTGGASEDVTWSTSDSGIATVTQGGLVDGVSDGSATIAATSDVDGTKSDSVIVTVTAESGGTAGDEQALQDMAASVNGLPWGTDVTVSSAPSDYVTVENDRVTAIDVVGLGLTGDIDNASIGNLTQMTYFNVMHNELGGNLPDELFSQCTSLVYLYLNFMDAYWNGSDDPHIAIQSGGGDLHTGKTDRGAKNKFTGQVPASTNLPNLEWFTLSWTEVSDIDLDAIFSNSHNLKGLLIANNVGMEGAKQPIPSSIGNATELTHLALNGTQIGEDAWGGELPASFSNLVKMEHFRITRNAFTGAVPDLSGWTEIKTFSASFVGFTSGFPDYLLDGSVTDRINAFGTHGVPNFNDAELPATIPFAVTVDVANSGLSGSLTESHFPDQLIVTDFSHNNLSGDGPADLSNLRGIRNLRWRHTNLGGQWPDLDWTNQQGLTWSDGSPANPVRNLSRAWFDHCRYVFRDALAVSNYNDAETQGKTLYEWYEEECEASFTVGNQKPFGSQSDYNASTGIIDFSAHVSHANNDYVWKRNGNVISGETGRSIDTDSYGTGDYVLEVTNSMAPKMGTITSVTITV